MTSLIICEVFILSIFHRKGIFRTLERIESDQPYYTTLFQIHNFVLEPSTYFMTPPCCFLFLHFEKNARISIFLVDCCSPRGSFARGRI